MRKLFKPIDYNEKAIEKSIETNGYIRADVKYDGVRQSLAVDLINGQIAFQTYAQEVLACLEWLQGTDAPFHKYIRMYRSDETSIYASDCQGFVLDLELCMKGLTFNESSGILRSKWLSEKNVMYHCGYLPRTKSDKVRFKLDPQYVEARLIDVLPLESLCDHAATQVDVFTELRVMHREIMLESLRKYPIAGLWYEPIETYEVDSMESLQNIYEDVREAGHEGLVLKDILMPYLSGKKSGWWKMKPNDSADGKIIGLVWGAGKNTGKVVGFEVELEDGMVVKATGLTEALMEEFTGNVLTHTGMFNSDEYQQNYVDASYYDAWYCQVNYMERFPDGSLRHPNFGGFRGTEGNPLEKV